MKPFQGIVRGAGKQPATQLGTSKTGMVVECNSISKGIKVEAFLDDNKNPVFEVYATGGSTGPSKRTFLLRIGGNKNASD